MLLTLSACYHATIETGLTPSTQTIEDKWADSWIAGLVPPATVETMERCPAGVARVETQQGFLNQVVGFFTLGIYTPMEIVVTCADDRGASLVTTKEDFEVAIVNGASFLIQAPRVIESDLTP
jgi:hypothetical protein